MRGRSKSRIRLNGLIVEYTNREAESQRESVDAKNQNGMFENESVVKNLISKLKQKTVEVRDGFVVKKENTETNSIGIQPNNIQETKKKRKVKEKDTMPTVHYVKRGFLKQQGIKCVNGVFDFK